MNNEYKKYLKSNKWKELKNKILERDGFRCTKCGSAKNLQVHHLTYENVYNEKEEDLVTLCASCHSKVHIKYDFGNSNLKFAKLFFDKVELLLFLTKIEINLLLLMIRDVKFDENNCLNMTPKRKKKYAEIIGLKSYRSITNSLLRMVDKGVLKDLRTEDCPYKFQINPYLFFKGNDYQRAKVIISYENGEREIRAFNDYNKMKEYLDSLEK